MAECRHVAAYVRVCVFTHVRLCAHVCACVRVCARVISGLKHPLRIYANPLYSCTPCTR